MMLDERDNRRKNFKGRNTRHRTNEGCLPQGKVGSFQTREIGYFLTRQFPIMEQRTAIEEDHTKRQLVMFLSND